ncbi:MAG TPA: hypothetical protein VMR14_06370 [Streptosporangiaceae bacterium]|nr:hypothetical protein [Streptosporangiaceae bacterium]
MRRPSAGGRTSKPSAGGRTSKHSAGGRTSKPSAGWRASKHSAGGRASKHGAGWRPCEPVARAALRLYPPAWRQRYGDEVLALIDDSGGGWAAALGLAAQAPPMWVWPPRHLHDPDARMRASIATVLAAWSFLTGLALVFVQFTQQQGFAPPAHPVVAWSYAAFDAALGASVLVIIAGSLPLWLVLLRRARRERRRRDLAFLLLPVVVPTAYLVAAFATVRLVHHPEASGPWWFIGFTIAGFAAAAVAAAGPIVTLRRLRPGGWTVRLAVRAAGVAAVTVAAAGLASGLAAAGLCRWAPAFPGYHATAALACYLIAVAVAAMTATVSAARGARAAFAR